MSDSKLVIVVDDDVDMLAWTRFVLEQAGFRVLCFPTADEALAAASAETPDLIITDLMMDTLHAGFTFAQRIRADECLAKVPVIVVTGAASQRGFDFIPRTEDDLKAMEVDALLPKPVRPDDLIARVRILLERADSDSGENLENHS